MKAHHTLIVLILSTLKILQAFPINERSISDVKSLILRADGKYDVTCRDGSMEVVTLKQIQEDSVCGGSCPAPSPSIEAIFSAPQDKFFVLCKTKSWSIATAEMIKKGEVCKTTGVTNIIGYYEGPQRKIDGNPAYFAGFPVKVQSKIKIQKWGIILTGTGSAEVELALYSDLNGAPSQLIAKSPIFPALPGRTEVGGDSLTISAGNYWLVHRLKQASDSKLTLPMDLEKKSGFTYIPALIPCSQSNPILGSGPLPAMFPESCSTNSHRWNLYIFPE